MKMVMGIKKVERKSKDRRCSTPNRTEAMLFS
jgi:hypothetical protein